MIKSMTGYGRAKKEIGGRNILVELKSVNNRYLDCSVKLPKLFGFLEEKIKSYVASKGISRGKVEIFVSIEILEEIEPREAKRLFFLAREQFFLFGTGRVVVFLADWLENRGELCEIFTALGGECYMLSE